jgi:hypothetical protein
MKYIICNKLDISSYGCGLDNYIERCSMNDLVELTGLSKKTINRWLRKYYDLETVDFHFGALYSAKQKIREDREAKERSAREANEVINRRRNMPMAIYKTQSIKSFDRIPNYIPRGYVHTVKLW